MHLNTDKRRFEDAFYKEIKYRNSFLSLEHNAHYEGKVYSASSFFISKQIRYNKTDRVEGTMTEDANGLSVELVLRPSFNGVRFYAATFVVSFKYWGNAFAGIFYCFMVGATGKAHYRSWFKSHFH
jgi:hypothetical protein